MHVDYYASLTGHADGKAAVKHIHRILDNWFVIFIILASGLCFYPFEYDYPGQAAQFEDLSPIQSTTILTNHGIKVWF